LKIGDLIDEDGRIRSEIVLSAEQTKGRRARRVFVNARLKRELAAYLKTDCPKSCSAARCSCRRSAVHSARTRCARAVGASYLIQKQNRSPRWTLAPNGLSNSTIGIEGTEPIGENFSVVFDLDAGFDLYSLRWSDGPGFVAANAGVPQNQATAYSDSSRAGQWYNGQGYVGLSSPTYGTLTAFRQNSLTLDAVFDYDPLDASYAFSPIGFQGITCGGGRKLRTHASVRRFCGRRKKSTRARTNPYENITAEESRAGFRNPAPCTATSGKPADASVTKSMV
jgi:hypothetical protein